jgi:hypothetical protein
MNDFREPLTLAVEQNSESDVPLPSRNFDVTRRVLAVVLVLSVLLPLGAVVSYGYFDYQRRIADASDIVDRLTRVAQEHALKIVDTNNEIETRILELLAPSKEGYENVCGGSLCRPVRVSRRNDGHGLCISRAGYRLGQHPCS